MSEQVTRMISNENIADFDKVATQMADVYRREFALPPWNERSRCLQSMCDIEYSGLPPDTPCVCCAELLSEAYPAKELIDTWREQLQAESALMEVALTDEYFSRVTIARPTTPNELYSRKYKGLSQMDEWLQSTLDPEIVWIEDTFADRRRQLKGNLGSRGATLGAIAGWYGGLRVATRTLQPSVIAATLRDCGEVTDMYVGERDVAVEGYRVRRVSAVPDARTLLSVEVAQ